MKISLQQLFKLDIHELHEHVEKHICTRHVFSVSPLGKCLRIDWRRQPRSVEFHTGFRRGLKSNPSRRDSTKVKVLSSFYFFASLGLVLRPVNCVFLGLYIAWKASLIFPSCFLHINPSVVFSLFPLASCSLPCAWWDLYCINASSSCVTLSYLMQEFLSSFLLHILPLLTGLPN